MINHIEISINFLWSENKGKSQSENSRYQDFFNAIFFIFNSELFKKRCRNRIAKDLKKLRKIPSKRSITDVIFSKAGFFKFFDESINIIFSGADKVDSTEMLKFFWARFFDSFNKIDVFLENLRLRADERDDSWRGKLIIERRASYPLFLYQGRDFSCQGLLRACVRNSLRRFWKGWRGIQIFWAEWIAFFRVKSLWFEYITRKIILKFSFCLFCN